MQIVSLGDNLHEMSKSTFWENKKNIFQNVACCSFYSAQLYSSKKVKCQCTTIILAILVALPFLMIYAKIQPC